MTMSDCYCCPPGRYAAWTGVSERRLWAGIAVRQRQAERAREAARRRRAARERRERQWRIAKEQERREREAAIAARKPQIRAEVARFAAYNRRYREAVERQWAIEAEVDRLKQLAVQVQGEVVVNQVDRTALAEALV
jgi:hypothetical protein